MTPAPTWEVDRDLYERTPATGTDPDRAFEEATVIRSPSGRVSPGCDVREPCNVGGCPVCDPEELTMAQLESRARRVAALLPQVAPAGHLRVWCLIAARLRGI